MASRRDAEKMILAGRVQVDGQTLAHPAFLVTGKSHVRVDGKELKKPEAARMWRYHKPPGLLTTARDPEGRPTVFDGLPKHLPRVISVGRLDFNSEGLLLFTNDGGLARHLETSELPRRYRIRIHLGNREAKLDEKKLKDLRHGITIDGIRYKPIEVKVEHAKSTNLWLELALKEGKNREIRKIMEHLGYQVNRLIRQGFGPFALGRLQQGGIEEIPASALRKLLPEFFKG
ncbi:MAG: rRNA pseudouridine synthase [Proteobacteria bacterium]|nr:rRNA pseudouridine synthase [Pseudomonadota bacterium]